ncbi:kinase-like domain-containing protein [Biscogniauxia mediterranea]|nr:kinase-like domain-containing protein [Biscogniauxia mediterranea]
MSTLFRRFTTFLWHNSYIELIYQRIRKYNLEMAQGSSNVQTPDHGLDNNLLETELGKNLKTNIYNENYMSTETIRKILNKHTIKTALPPHLSADTITTIYNEHIIVLAVLFMLSRGGQIVQAMKSVSDRILPLRAIKEDNRTARFYRNDADIEPEFFHGWTKAELEGFDKWQWIFMVRHMGDPTGEKSDSRHFKLRDPEILPWYDPEVDQPGQTPPSVLKSSKDANEGVLGGSFGDVTHIGIDPQCHYFDKTFEKLKLSERTYALKVLKLKGKKNTDNPEYRREVNQLRRFNGQVNPHIVTLLASYTHRGQNCFIFPWADCNLSTFWEQNSPMRDIKSVRWLASQLLGISRAVLTIHEPNHLEVVDSSPLYGRHGDLKPDNILCYSTTDSDYKRFVIADFGLSSIHREASRTYVPDPQKPRTPGYRPPESDGYIKDGEISRNYDIWTLGCLFMEMLIWYLGGNDWVEKFRDDRTSPYIVGNINIFYDICAKPGNAGNGLTHPGVILQLKPQVVKWYKEIYSHERCSGFIYDLCKIIEDRMLLVTPSKTKREMAGSLVDKIESITDKRKDNSYFLDRYKNDENPSLKPGVEFTLTENAQEAIRKFGTQLPVYDPNRKFVWGQKGVAQ